MCAPIADDVTRAAAGQRHPLTMCFFIGGSGVRLLLRVSGGLLQPDQVSVGTQPHPELLDAMVDAMVTRLPVPSGWCSSTAVVPCADPHDCKAGDLVSE